MIISATEVGRIGKSQKTFDQKKRRQAKTEKNPTKRKRVKRSLEQKKEGGRHKKED